MSPGVRARVGRDWYVYPWDAATGEVRLMCSWDTTPAAVDACGGDVARAGQTAKAGS